MIMGLSYSLTTELIFFFLLLTIKDIFLVLFIISLFTDAVLVRIGPGGSHCMVQRLMKTERERDGGREVGGEK